MRVLMAVSVRMRVIAGGQRRRVGVVVAVVAVMAGCLTLVHRGVAGRCGCDDLTLQENDTQIKIALVGASLAAIAWRFGSMFT